jgi:hypothetical protein
LGLVIAIISALLYITGLVWSLVIWRWDLIGYSVGALCLGPLILKVCLIPARIIQNLGATLEAGKLALLVFAFGTTYKNICAVLWATLVSFLMLTKGMPAYMATLFIVSYTWSKGGEDGMFGNTITVLCVQVACACLLMTVLVTNLSLLDAFMLAGSVMATCTAVQVILLIRWHRLTNKNSKLITEA